MSTVTLTLGPTSWGWQQILNDEAFQAVTGAYQTAGRTGNRWGFVLTYLNLTSTRRQTMFGTGSALLGRRNRLQVNMSTLGYIRQGAGGGTPLLNGALVAGATSLVIDGASISITNWLKASDWITIGNELKMVTTSVNTNGSGQATIPIWPELHQNRADNTAVNISTPYGVFYLKDPLSATQTPLGSEWLTDSLVLNLEEDVVA